ncbi:TPA: tRNA (adenosine(37)-N6)-threonylcarbamoyltransferase complex transferase subunit TsaD [Patescibacteria group bacterium]|uniref:tRNA N6-adenosine threonylcarbamoyltransferase n=1 Tax=Candidatus Gottesmanbacteria bacterium GW2011_GWA1_43_11 TaxID=1618436 RepID=A0A0G1CID8_9BACT|nr:MAG: putative tRNA threonylcarbamoyladenosine biosynthesis protein Gcp [Candidatus Gottesmanbacteria bacterium GW2011_GWA1_43_11]HCS79247.1 tRNA (adenosine(37)-N6)-threonylcarbamoyltransferase complex transferase subunit TsaD [Patescibacteria group bacterium]
MNILGIETSFDETAAAVVRDGKTVLANVTATSNLLHRKYGGVVPEVAARKQVESMIPVLTEVMQGMTPNDVDAIAVTVGPGLIGSLLIGVETAKTLAAAWNKPIIPVNHILTHMYANFIQTVIPTNVEGSHLTTTDVKDSSPPKADRNDNVIFPAISLVVSGGHTELYLMINTKTLKWLGGTLDDAAGEAFDKSARLLGFENRGGIAIEEAATHYSHPDQSASGRSVEGSLATDSGVKDSSPPKADRNDIRLPRPMLHDNSLNFSFSGLKTALLREVKKLIAEQQFDNTATRLPARQVQQLSFEVQEAITDVLITKTLRAVEQHNAQSILLSGGVAANKRLWDKFNQQLTTHHLQLFAPQRELCTDNAVMIAACAYYLNNPVPWSEVTARPDLSVEV